MSVHVAEGFEGLRSLVSTVHVVEQAVGAEIRYRGDGSVLRYERPGQRGCKVYSGDYVVRIGVHFAHSLAEPAFVADLRGFGGVPDVHRTEVGPVGHRVTHAVDDRNFAIVVQFLDGAHSGVEPVLVVQRDHVFLLDADVWPVVYVFRVGVRHDTVEIVVAPGELHHDQFSILCFTHNGLASLVNVISQC